MDPLATFPIHVELHAGFEGSRLGGTTKCCDTV